MIKDGEQYFNAGIGIEIVFNLETDIPITKQSIILEYNKKSRIMIIAQTTPQIFPSTSYDQMHVTTLVKKELAQKFRVGYKCEITNFLTNYKLANNNTIPAIQIQYHLPPIELNIRSAFRLKPTAKHEVLGKLIFNGKSYFSGKDFKVFNISITGIGFLIPKTIKGKVNPLINFESGHECRLGIVLRNRTGPEEILTLTTSVRVMRANNNHTKEFGFAGMLFTKMKQIDEDKLSKFVHDAQMYEIRLFSGLT